LKDFRGKKSQGSSNHVPFVGPQEEIYFQGLYFEPKAGGKVKFLGVITTNKQTNKQTNK